MSEEINELKAKLEAVEKQNQKLAEVYANASAENKRFKELEEKRAAEELEHMQARVRELSPDYPVEGETIDTLKKFVSWRETEEKKIAANAAKNTPAPAGTKKDPLPVPNANTSGNEQVAENANKKVQPMKFTDFMFKNGGSK